MGRDRMKMRLLYRCILINMGSLCLPPLTGGTDKTAAAEHSSDYFYPALRQPNPSNVKLLPKHLNCKDKG